MSVPRRSDTTYALTARTGLPGMLQAFPTFPLSSKEAHSRPSAAHRLAPPTATNGNSAVTGGRRRGHGSTPFSSGALKSAADGCPAGQRAVSPYALISPERRTCRATAPCLRCWHSQQGLGASAARAENKRPRQPLARSPGPALRQRNDQTIRCRSRERTPTGADAGAQGRAPSSACTQATTRSGPW
jgi:hypothetical protein